MWQVVEPNIETVRRRLAARVRLRSGGARDHAQRERGAAGGAARARPEARRRGRDDEPGLPAHARHVGPARAPRWHRRSRRSRFPVPPPTQADLADRLTRRDHAATKVLHFCHITNLTGQIFPVRDICRRGARAGASDDRGRRARLRALPVQGWPTSDATIYGTSLHKWLLAPVGTGFLYVRRRGSRSIWPLTPANDEADRRHPQVRGDRHAPGGRPQRHRRGAGVPPGDRRRAKGRAAAVTSKTAGRGGSRPTAARVLTSFDPAQSCAIGNLSLDGRRPAKLAEHLWSTHRIFVTPIKHEEFEGIRVTPNVYTTLERNRHVLPGDRRGARPRHSDVVMPAHNAWPSIFRESAT